MERVHSTGAIRVAHELVDVAAPGLLGVVTGCGLKGGKDGREEGRGRGRHSPLTFPKAGKTKGQNCVLIHSSQRLRTKGALSWEAGSLAFILDLLLLLFPSRCSGGGLQEGKRRHRGRQEERAPRH